MSDLPDKIIGIDGRLWIKNEEHLEIDAYSHPLLNPNQPITDNKCALTMDGNIYHIPERSMAELPYVIKQISNYKMGLILALAEDGKLLEVVIKYRRDGTMKVRHTIIAEDIDYIVKYYVDHTDTDFLTLINKKGQWQFTNRCDQQIGLHLTTSDDNRLPTVDEIISNQPGHRRDTGALITTRGITSEIPLNQSPPRIIDAINDPQVDQDGENINDDIIMLDDQGKVFVYSEGRYRPSDNDMLNNLNNVSKWVKLIGMSKNCVGIVNEAGETYKLNNNFMLSTSKMPIGVFKVINRVKNPQTRI